MRRAMELGSNHPAAGESKTILRKVGYNQVYIFGFLLLFSVSRCSRLGEKGVRTLVEAINNAWKSEPLSMLFPFVRNYLSPFLIWLMVTDE